MKGIIVMAAIALAAAIGGEASGQTQEEVNEIIRGAKQIGIADLRQCKANRQHLEIAKIIVRTHYMQIAYAKIAPPQMLESVCRFMERQRGERAKPKK